MINYNLIFISSLTSLSCFFLGLFVLLKNPKRKENLYFFLINAGTMIWTLSDSLGQYLIYDYHILTLYISRFIHIGVILISTNLTFLVDHLLPKKMLRYQKLELILRNTIFILSIFVVFLLPTNLIIIEVTEKVTPIEIPGSLYGIILLLLTISFLYNLIRLYLGSKEDEIEKKRLQYFLLAVASGLIAILFVSLITSLFEHISEVYYILGTYSTYFIYTLIASYSIVKHKLIDINVIISRGLARFITIVIYLILFLIFHKVLSFAFNDYFNNFIYVLFFSFIFSVMIAFFHSTIYNTILSIPQSMLLKDHYNVSGMTQFFSNKMGKTIELMDFFRVSEQVFGVVLQSKSVKIFLREDFQTDQIHFSEKKFLFLDQFAFQLSQEIYFLESNRLVVEMEKKHNVILFEETKPSIKRELEKFKSKVAIPCIARGELLGFLLLGEKFNNKPFSHDDHILFEIMISEIGIVLDRILAYSHVFINLEKTQKSLTVTQFINEYVHEIKTPLTTLEGYATMDSVTVEELQEVMLEQSRRIQALLSNILKIANEQRKKEIKKINLNQVIESVLSLFSDMGKKVRELDPHLPEIWGDFEDFQIVFTNLMKNAKEAMLEKARSERQLTVKTSFLPESNEVHFSVTDTGSGIPEENLQNIWDRYKVNSVKKGGTGLGLSIVKRIVNDHKGTIEVVSKVSGKGSHTDSPSTAITGTSFMVWINLEENRKEFEPNQKLQ